MVAAVRTCTFPFARLHHSATAEAAADFARRLAYESRARHKYGRMGGALLKLGVSIIRPAVTLGEQTPCTLL